MHLTDIPNRDVGERRKSRKKAANYPTKEWKISQLRMPIKIGQQRQLLMLTEIFDKKITKGNLILEI